MSTDKPNIAKLLRDGADLIDREGHYPHNKEGHCALTSLVGEWKARDAAFDYLTQYLGFDDCSKVYRWNDSAAPGVVQRTMRKVADNWEKENSNE